MYINDDELHWVASSYGKLDIYIQIYTTHNFGQLADACSQIVDARISSIVGAAINYIDKHLKGHEIKLVDHININNIGKLSA